ncbi:11836_t:CDS:2 [Scutellospora calospora]|uniref:11836_t:CDS:1 n=1 Tax=Scutellospora calospora TaxID=85575 RepID=A0ACA9KJX9_9GLOM|nr:11836_t:CDS:2 [Scutellospora calospora]
MSNYSSSSSSITSTEIIPNTQLILVKCRLNMSFQEDTCIALVNYDSDTTLSESGKKSPHEICHLAETFREINKKQNQLEELFEKHNEYIIALQKKLVEHEKERDNANRD